MIEVIYFNNVKKDFANLNKMSSFNISCNKFNSHLYIEIYFKIDIMNIENLSLFISKSCIYDEYIKVINLLSTKKDIYIL